jgi:hypothetical protein
VQVTVLEAARCAVLPRRIAVLQVTPTEPPAPRPQLPAPIGPVFHPPLNSMSVLCVADAAGVPGAPELAGRPGGDLPAADSLCVPPALPQPSSYACSPGP